MPTVVHSVTFEQEWRRHAWLAIIVLAIVSGFMLAIAAPAAAAPPVLVRIDLSAQRMQISIGGRPTYNWAVSTARPGYRTPTGRFRPIRLERAWYSSKYDSAPMPHSVFFYGGYAIHGTYETRNLGRPVSHGCVRLHPANASVLFNLVRTYGAGNVTIIVTR